MPLDPPPSPARSVVPTPPVQPAQIETPISMTAPSIARWLMSVLFGGGHFQRQLRPASMHERDPTIPEPLPDGGGTQFRRRRLRHLITCATSQVCCIDFGGGPGDGGFVVAVDIEESVPFLDWAPKRFSPLHASMCAPRLSSWRFEQFERRARRGERGHGPCDAQGARIKVSLKAPM